MRCESALVTDPPRRRSNTLAPTHPQRTAKPHDTEPPWTVDCVLLFWHTEWRFEWGFVSAKI